MNLRGGNMKHNLKNKKIICDIDNTICMTIGTDYKNAKPWKERIDFLNSLYTLGNEIVYFTARGTETGIDWRKLTEKQFKEWGVKYTKLIFGKPAGDVYIDDLAINSIELFGE